MSQPWHAMPTADVLATLETGAAGLSEEEAQRRLGDAGGNELPTHRAPSWPARLVHQLASPLVAILVAAAGLSLFLGEWVDAVVIAAILVANAGLGLAQEMRADRALQALASMLRPTVRVRRSDQLQELDARHLVPGDVVELTAGDRIPADVRWIRSRDVEVDESVLTGESAPVGKDVSPIAHESPLHDRTSLGFQATDVVAGQGVAVVVATGQHTAFGLVAALAGDAQAPPTPLQRQLAQVGRRLGALALAMSAGIVLIGWAAGHDAMQMLLAGASLAVAAVPEGLPAVVTLTLAFGVRRLAARHVLLRRLQAAETLGAATVICTDKTGTLTEGKMVVRELWTPAGHLTITGSGYEPRGKFLDSDGQPTAPPPEAISALQGALDASVADLQRGPAGTTLPVGSPTEAALVAAARKADLARRPSEITVPFDSRGKRMVVQVGDEAITKGAHEVVVPLCDGDEAMRAVASEVVAAWGEAGLRTLAVASGPAGERPVLRGLFAMLDAPRPEARAALEAARGAGIDVIMVTGDAETTARGIAAQIGHEGSIVARATPEDKLVLVRRLQAEGHVVAMTGDGVNDAPALQQADVGVAMGIRGTDVARAAADVVLTDDHFASIVGGIEEGRRQLDNIRKFVRYLLSSNVGEVLAIGANLALGGPLLLLPVQLLWMNLVTDGVTALALGLEPAEPDTMSRPPASPGASLLPARAVWVLMAAGTYLAVAAVTCFHVALQATGDLQVARTAAFTALVVLEKVNVLNYRGLRTPLWKQGWLTNPWLLGAIAFTLSLHAAAVYAPPLQGLLHTAPLRAADLGLIGLFAVPILAIPEIVKSRRGGQ